MTTPKLSLMEMLAKGKQQKEAVAEVITEKTAERMLFGTGLTKKTIAASLSAERKAVIQSANAPAMQVEAPVISLDVSLIPKTIANPGLELDEFQAAAVAGIAANRYSCLIGKAGTGKTTTSKAVIAAIEPGIPTIDLNTARVEQQQTNMEDFNLSMCIVAFTGRAVQQIKRALPIEYHPLCNTVHSTLGYAPTIETFYDESVGAYVNRQVFRPRFDSMNKLPFSVCIVEEAGMLGVLLWNELIAALPDDCRIIMLGDINQLPPVQSRSVLGFAMINWPTFTLNKLHRNAGVIASNAHRILEGRNPLKDPAAFAMIELPGGGFETQQQIQAVVQKLHKQGVFDPMRDALIVPQNVGTIGQEALNTKLVHYFNPEQRENGVVLNKRTTINAGRHTFYFAIGDKVMILANDRKRGLTNGMTGVITDIVINAQYRGEALAKSLMHEIDDIQLDLSNLDHSINEAQIAIDKEKEDRADAERQATHIVTIQFQDVDEPVEFQTVGEYKKFSHAYAFTCHKSQGGEYPTVVIVCHSANSVMLTREWLYTAVTRAQQRVILLYNPRGLQQAITRQAIKGNTIEEKALSFIALSDDKDTTMPNLPKPQLI